MYDLSIIGGGPAGASAAYTARKAGLSTVLVDTAEFPRVKPCGGAVSEQAMSCLDFAVPREIQQADVFGARVHFRGQKTITARHSNRIAVIVNRAEFDQFLLSKARSVGAEVYERHHVNKIEPHEDHVVAHSVKKSFESRFCIIASGATSILVELVRPKLSKNEYSIAVELDIPDDRESILQYSAGLLDIYFGEVNMGYGWVFPHGTWFNVGIAGIAAGFEHAPQRLNSFVDSLPHTISSRQCLATNRVGFPIPAGGKRRMIARGRILLAGDAAGFVDSFSGEGIAYAIRSGILAARAVATSPRPASSYSRWCHKEIDRPLQYSLLFAKLLHRFPNMFLKVFATNPRVLQQFLAVPARETTYGEFIRWFAPRLPGLLARIGWRSIK